jgi:transcriptional regulator with XRE-family HTH domain
MPKDSTPAEKISSLRSALGMNQEEFAEALEVAQGVVSAWERGEYKPSPESYVKLANLAAKRVLPDETLWFLERTGIHRPEVIADVLVKESRRERDAIYSQALREAQAIYPNDGIAQHRFAMRAADRMLRKKGKRA